MTKDRFGDAEDGPAPASITIAGRRPGHSKLVYDKATRTIVAVPNKGHTASLTPREVAAVGRAICCPGGCKSSPGSTVCMAYQVEDVARGAILAFLSAQVIEAGTTEIIRLSALVEGMERALQSIADYDEEQHEGEPGKSAWMFAYFAVCKIAVAALAAAPLPVGDTTD